ncbi:alpha/beta fold hydrolase [Actinomadura violacea]|uniref:Alpha/beta hydrolase n=1 Tax=Actinomadura violacea TaxID=2819934 RepID=A0ABS3S4S1_9ACTN|nr:alpha/beta hydrolase [Actinomadura violacea]MBO2463994.1 alpha/beta hydrolase [Actinomadura violacea]
MIRFGYADTPLGQVHYAESGVRTGPPLILLHQTPRSWDEFREAIPRLAAGRHVIAPDTPGFGASARITEHSIENYAAGILGLLDAMGVDEFDLAGHHTGGVVAVEACARAPKRVRRLVLSSTPYIDEAARKRRASRPAIDAVAERPDGSHLTELWRRRAAFYPGGRSDLLTRFVRDALRVWPDVEHGHAAVSAYRMEERIGLIACPVLCVGASADPYAFPELGPLTEHIPHAETAVIEGGGVPLEFQAAEFARLTAAFLGRT